MGHPLLQTQHWDVMIIGAGAAGLMCAITSGQRGRKTLLLEHANKPGKKILMSGGGRCNFTNLHIHPECYQSHNPHFCKSALSRYTQYDFIDLVKKHQIPFHEKTKGQLFCNHRAQDILDLLLTECQSAQVQLQLQTQITSIQRTSDTARGFEVTVSFKPDPAAVPMTLKTQSLVIATGGLSIPTMGASAFGYQVATQFGLRLWPTRAGLVPLTLHREDKTRLAPLSGISVPGRVRCGPVGFEDPILLTHRGLSGPGILQISSYWQPGEPIELDLLPNLQPHAHLEQLLKQAQRTTPKQQLNTLLYTYLPERLVNLLIPPEEGRQKLAQLTSIQIQTYQNILQSWIIKPNQTEGYRTAEVTLGGVDCDAVSSKTMESHAVKGLYFIGEVLDVTGWLGGYNFQWAWSSGWAAGQVA